MNRIDPQGLWFIAIHRSFGYWGVWPEGYKGLTKLEGTPPDGPFDYGRLDIDKPARNLKYRPLHFKSKYEIMSDIICAIGEGDSLEFEYLMHQWQDTYTHYDRDHTWGHILPSADNMDWSDPEDVDAYMHCHAMTMIFEQRWFKNNPDQYFELSWAPMPTENPWLSTSGIWRDDF